MQPAPVLPGYRPAPGFQYPRSDRRRCNFSCRSCSARSAWPTFSILGRIGGDATTPTPVPTPVCSWLSVSSVGSEAMQPQVDLDFDFLGFDFQYPRSDRRRCNFGPVLDGGAGGGAFQYPRSDRRRCNRSGDGKTDCCARTFSILGRIGGDATLPNCGTAGRPWLLSVSSVGSEAMQLGATQRNVSR